MRKLIVLLSFTPFIAVSLSGMASKTDKITQPVTTSPDISKKSEKQTDAEWCELQKLYVLMGSSYRSGASILTERKHQCLGQSGLNCQYYDWE